MISPPQRKQPGPSHGHSAHSGMAVHDPCLEQRAGERGSLPMRLEPRAGRAWDGRPHVEGVRQTGGRSPTFFALGQRFTQLRNAPGNEWLPDCGCGSVRPACGYMGDAYAACLDPDCPDRGQRTHCKSTPGRACCRARVAVIGCTVVTGLCWTRTPVPPANIPARLYDRGIALYMLDRDVRARLAERTRTMVGTVHPGLELRGLATRPCQPRANDQEPTRFEERT